MFVGVFSPFSCNFLRTRVVDSWWSEEHLSLKLVLVSFFLFLWFCESDWTCGGNTLSLSLFSFFQIDSFSLLLILLFFFSKSTFDIDITFNFGSHSKLFIQCHCYLNNRTTTAKITNQTILNRECMTATTTPTLTWTIIFKLGTRRIFSMS